jgi:Na+/H+-dicarboxylate symporter
MTKNRLPSSRNFGFLFAGFFALLSAYAAYHGADAFKVYGWLIAGMAVGLVAVAAPGLLTPFNKAWMKLGELMGKVISPLVLGVIFFVLITPIALLTRLFGRDELRLKRTNTQSYWIDRTPPGPAGDSFKNQF